MSSLQQILLGSSLLALNATIHVLAVAFSLPVFKGLSDAMPLDRRPTRRIIFFLLLTLAVLIAAHRL